MVLVALLSLVTASLSFTLSVAAIGSPIRERSMRLAPWLGKLVGCGYCTGHWIALGLVLIYRPRIFGGWEPLDLVLTALVVGWLAAFQWAALSSLARHPHN